MPSQILLTDFGMILDGQKSDKNSTESLHVPSASSSKGWHLTKMKKWTQAPYSEFNSRLYLDYSEFNSRLYLDFTITPPHQTMSVLFRGPVQDTNAAFTNRTFVDVP